MTIIAALQANEGTAYRYPFARRLVKLRRGVYAPKNIR
jgi:hypothetical protein